jgi:glutamate synthase (ferredoxin)
VTSEYLVNSDEIQIKMAQGAKPGEGGSSPGHKVWPWIAKVRHSTPGVALISPPPHHDIYSIEDLAQLIHDLKNANPRARISVKLVAEVGVGTVAAGVAKAHSDVVLISGHDGGTGASPLTSLKHAGIPWELGLAETQQTLVLNRLRDRIVVQTDGQLKTGRDVVIAALWAPRSTGSRPPPGGHGLHHDAGLPPRHLPGRHRHAEPAAREKFAGRAEHVVNFFQFVAQEVRELMAELGFRTVDEMIGRSDLLDMKRAIGHYKSQGLDFSKIFYRPDVGPDVAVRRIHEQDHGIDKALDQSSCRSRRRRWSAASRSRSRMPIRNVTRTVGTILGSELTAQVRRRRVCPTTRSRSSSPGRPARASGRFVPRGMTLILEGDANDYVGKGLSGGKIVVFPPREARFVAEENIVAGNVLLYGATAGRAFFRGRVGERFAVRNSGALTVVEGTGDHGCEYMTGGTVVVIGPTGRNFAAGMSGGSGLRPRRGRLVRVPMQPRHGRPGAPGGARRPDPRPRPLIQHAGTPSAVAARILGTGTGVEKFVKVMPVDYRRVLDERNAGAERSSRCQGSGGERWVSRPDSWNSPDACPAASRGVQTSARSTTRCRCAGRPGRAVHGLRHPVLPPGAARSAT